MASTYSINLQAKLDTTQVQQELKKLKSMQQEMQGPAGGAAQAGFGNTSSLEATLRSLNQSIVQLQKTIQKMPQQVGNQVGKAAAPAAAGSSAFRLPASVSARRYMPENWRHLAPDVQEVMAMGWYKAQRNYQPLEQWRVGRSFKIPKGMNIDQAALVAYQNYQIDEWKKANVRAEKRRDMTSGRMLRRAGSIFVGGMFNPVAEGLEMAGMSKTAAVMKGLGEGITEGFTSNLALRSVGVAGPWGKAIAGAYAVATAAMKIKEGLDQVDDAVEQYGRTLKHSTEQLVDNAQGMAQSRSLFKTDFEAAQTFLGKDFKTARQKREESEAQYKLDREYFMGLADPWVKTTDILEEAERRKKGKSLKDKTRIDIQAQEDISAYTREFSQAQSQMNASKAAYEAWKSVEDRLKSERNEWNKVVIKRREAVRLNTENFAEQMRGRDQVNSSEIFALGILRNRQMAPRLQFDQISSELDKLRNERNERLNEAFALNRQIQNAGTNLSPARLETMVKNRDKAMENADLSGKRISILENALTQIKEMVPHADFSGVTSLAQYGFNMGERDTRDKAAEDYYWKMESLTQQIRDKLDEGIKTQAVYGD